QSRGNLFFLFFSSSLLLLLLMSPPAHQSRFGQPFARLFWALVQGSATKKDVSRSRIDPGRPSQTAKSLGKMLLVEQTWGWNRHSSQSRPFSFFLSHSLFLFLFSRPTRDGARGGVDIHREQTM